MTDTTTPLAPGDVAPALTLTGHDGKPHALSDHRGRRTVVYFYPAAYTPGCTTEACDFRDNIASLRGAGYDVLGISPDPVDKLATFAADEYLPFPLLSDPEGVTARAWGAWGEKTVGGQVVTGLLRSTFVIDETGTITRAEYRVNPDGHVLALRAALGV